MKKILSTLVAVYAALFAVSALFAEEEMTNEAKKLEKAMASSIRTQKEIDRDSNRKPKETLEFFGLKEDMKVVELLPGGGWYTKLLGPLLAEKGELSVAVGLRRVKKLIEEFDELKKVESLESNDNLHRAEGARFYTMDNFDFPVSNVDMVLTFRNYHNFDKQGRMILNKAAFKALKPGGVYGVVDHTRRHMQDLDNENRRRFDPVLAIKEIQEAGFVFMDYSDLHYRLDDELRYEVGRRTVTGNTDRFTLKFIKPRK